MMTRTSFFALMLCSLLASYTAAADELGCNICGCPNCTYGRSDGVVNFWYNNKAEKRPCELLQQEVENPTIYNRTYCRNVIWRQAFEPCFCYDTNDPEKLLTDIPDYKDFEYGNAGILAIDGTGDNGGGGGGSGGGGSGGDGDEDGDGNGGGSVLNGGGGSGASFTGTWAFAFAAMAAFACVAW